MKRHVIKTYAWIHEIIMLKGKAIPWQAWIGPEGFRSLRLPDFMTNGT
jgi:hypothetical protein